MGVSTSFLSSYALYIHAKDKFSQFNIFSGMHRINKKFSCSLKSPKKGWLNRKELNECLVIPA
jgi:hypothetical protein